MTAAKKRRKIESPGLYKSINALNHFVCKQRAPFPLAAEDWIDENSNWGPKRIYGYFNNWCPPILQCLCANHDIKLIMNGTETKHIAWYITHYVAKKQKTSSNISALLAKTLAYHVAGEWVATDCCGNALSREQELSAPEVIGYLMGWGDCFISHRFETIHWPSVVRLLKKAYPVLDIKRNQHSSTEDASVFTANMRSDEHDVCNHVHSIATSTHCSR
ncbi:hypothetical protein EDB84DRAFT_1447399 [Lactarius hengduanensis]|nr:hypothetical protein EDB84DRAFT_1447399 [Lactarius hengduanensis]